MPNLPEIKILGNLCHAKNVNFWPSYNSTKQPRSVPSLWVVVVDVYVHIHCVADQSDSGEDWRFDGTKNCKLVNLA